MNVDLNVWITINIDLIQITVRAILSLARLLAVLGAQMSRKRYSYIPSIAGAVIGASLGHQISNYSQVKHRKHCQPTERAQMECHQP